MLSLPQIGEVPRAYRESASNPLAARLSLALAGDKPIHAPRRDVQGIEIDTLQRQLQQWLAQASADLELIDLQVHLSLNQVGVGQPGDAEGDAYTVWLKPANEDLVCHVWHLERRWRALENSCPGLAAAALLALEKAGLHSFPLFTPGAALHYASQAWWWGEENEEYVLAEYREEAGKPDAPAPDDMPTRAKFDKALPPEVVHPRTKLRRSDLERLARRHTDAGAIARGVLELTDLCAATHRGKKHEVDFRSCDDNGYLAASFAAALRWNARDPMFRVFDDYTNQHYEGEGCEALFGWYEMDNAKDLPRLLPQIEAQIRIAAAIERLLPLVATRHRP